MTRRNSVRTPDAPPGSVPRRNQRVLNDERLDPYQARGKYQEPTVCSDCGAVFRRGRWAHGDAPDGANRDRCPACRRIREKLPAGWVVLEGPFYAAHRDELLRLVRHEADNERLEHPINRIMDIEEHSERAVVTTTDIHTPHRIGTALERAYQGELEMRYGDEEYSIRVSWRR
jgi:NMD protein affecting ribosome stability and mRNA decay